MSGTFNGYHVWLGIPPNEQPPNHYRLLGIAGFETDLDVIDHAADRQMAHVRTFQSGQHGALSQQILNELSAARLCLLTPEKKAAYDEQLRATLSATQVVAAVPIGKALPVARPVAAVAAGGAIPMAVPTARPSGIPQAKPVGGLTPRAAGASGTSTARPAGNSGISTGRPAGMNAARLDVSDDDQEYMPVTSTPSPVVQSPVMGIDFDPINDSSAPSVTLRMRRRRRGDNWQRDLRLVSVAAMLLVTFLGLYWFYRLAASGELGEAVRSLEQNFSPSGAPVEVAPQAGESNQPAPRAEPPASEKKSP